MSKRKLIKPAGLPVPDDAFTPGLRYGDWVFVSGISATDYKAGLAPEVAGNPAVPLAGEDLMLREARYVLKTIDRIVTEGGAKLQSAVRVDQFPISRAMLDPYHIARKEVIDSPRPASTSVDIWGLPCPDAHIQVEMISAVEKDGFRKEGIFTDKIPQPLGGYAPAIRIGDFVFLAGQIASDFKTGVAAEASVHPNFWEGNPIDLETRFTLKNMDLTLQAAGSSLRNVVKAQVYLTDMDDLPRFDRAWREFFPSEPPARTVYPVRSLGVAGGRIEINFVALVDDGKTKKEIVEAKGARKSLFGEPHAVKAGEFLFLSGLLAADESGLVDSARVRPGYPYNQDTAAAQMHDIMQQAQQICAAAKTDLRNGLRLLTVHTDLREHYAAARARQGYFPDGQPVTNAIQVAAPLQVPGCSILADLWVATES